MKLSENSVAIIAALVRFAFRTSLLVFFMYAAITLMSGCSKEGEKEETASNEQIVEKDKEDKKSEVKNCTVIDTEEGAVVSCPDGSTVLIKDGNDGEDAPLCQIEVVQTCE
jgi:hypothetical protein